MLIHTIRDAVRLLRKSRGFTAVAVLTLALGIGANTAVFSVVDAVLLQPLPYAAPGRLVSLKEAQKPRMAGSSVAPANLAEYRGAQSFEALAGFNRFSMNLTKAGPPEHVRGEAVTWNLFEVLGVSPSLGRPFRADDDREGAERVVILAHAFWRARFAADPAILGRTITLNGESYAVIGVMPDSFQALTEFGSGFPISCFTPASYSSEALADRSARTISVVGRLTPQATIERAQAELQSISENLGRRFPETNHDVTALIAPLSDDVVGDVRVLLIVSLCAVGLVLLTACVNLANLLIVRTLGQQREMAIRMAMGATHAQIALDLAVRGLILGVMGGAAGLVCGLWTRDGLVAMAPISIPRLEHLALNLRVLAVTTVLSLATGVVAGLLPAISMRRGDTAPTLRASALTTSGVRSMARWQGLLMGAQIAAALMLAIGAGLLVRSHVRLMTRELGYQTEGVLTLTVRPPDTRYRDQAARARFFDEMERRIAAIPGVQTVAAAHEFPMRGPMNASFIIDGTTSRAGVHIVSAGYFGTLGIPLRRGRLPAAADRSGAPHVAVVSESFVRRFMAGRDPIGRRFQYDDDGRPSIEIVGVVGDVRRDGKQAEFTPQVYLPAAQIDVYTTRLSAIAVRASSDPYALVPAIQRAIWSVDPDQPITNVQTLDDVVSRMTAGRRFYMSLLGVLAALAGGLALVGVYGVVAHAAAQRTREIGIRIALGADRRSVITLVVANGMKWALTGVAAGLAGGYVGARFMTGMLFGIPPTDVTTFAVMAALTLAVAWSASYVPARRAASVDPVTALRSE